MKLSKRHKNCRLGRIECLMGFPVRLIVTFKLFLTFKISEIVQRISIIVCGVSAHPTVCGRSLSSPETIHKSAHQRLESGKPLSAASSPDKALGLHLGSLTLPTLSQNSYNVPSSLSLKTSLKILKTQQMCFPWYRRAFYGTGHLTF